MIYNRIVFPTTLLILLATLLSVSVSTAQPYKSIFGSGSSQWTVLIRDIYTTGIDPPGQYNITYSVSGDTVVDGQSWKKVSSPFVIHEPINMFLLREDVMQGKVWLKELYRGYPLDPDTTAYLVAD